MTTITEIVETRLPIDQAFEYIANFENIVAWDPGVTAAARVSETQRGVGSEYALELQYGGSPLSMVYRVVEWDAPHLVVLEGDGDRSSAVDRISLLEIPLGTRVVYEADIRLKGIFRLAQPFLGGLFRGIGEGAREGLDARLVELAGQSDA